MNVENKIPEWAKDKVLYEVNIRQYTEEGTLAAFSDQIPRLRELGAGILWLMPVQPIGKANRKGSLGSYYSIRDYTAINPDYGTETDFHELVQRAHASGMYVILDWVANHTAWDSRWREEHPEFYSRDAQGNFHAPNPDWTDTMQLDYGNPELRLHMIESMKHWVRKFDIDGFRCDMAHLVQTSFWEQARAELEQLKPVFMLAESEARDLMQKAFSVEYSWRLHHLSNQIAQQIAGKAELQATVEKELNELPAATNPMLFTSNHDENSWNGSAPERLSFGLETLNVLMFTLPGVPLIYSGQEAGLSRSLSFFEKDPIPWQDDKMFLFYKRLAALKQRSPALWGRPYGGAYTELKTHNPEIFAFARRKDEHVVLVMLNLSYKPVEFDVNVDDFAGVYKEVFTQKTRPVSPGNRFMLKPWKYLVFETDSFSG